MTYLLEFCRAKANSVSILIFSTRSGTFLEPLAKFLQESGQVVGLITGQVSDKQRSEFIDQFQTGQIKILLCNIQSASLGLNLSAAEVAIFADRSYSPADNDQAEARFLPVEKGEKKAKLIIDLICKGSVDEKIRRLLDRKRDITKVIGVRPGYLVEEE
jgi:SNF2 family DNA or RNA helicase